MRKTVVVLLLIIIGISGVFLRFIDYDKTPPFGETQDEFFYPWAGLTWLNTGNPVAWSWFPSYPQRQVVIKWGINYPLVSPWIEKPPLYTLLMGLFMKMHGTTDIFNVRLSVVRIVPIILSFLTIIFTGILGMKVFSVRHGLLAALLYAVVPTIILANRLSLTENLLTSLILLALIIYLDNKLSVRKYLQAVLVGICAGLTILTKNIGIAAGISLLCLYFLRKRWSGVLITGILCLLGFLIHPAIGLYYDWNLYQGVMHDYQREFANSGLPELIPTIFLYPTIGSKDHVFLDGSMLAGYLLFFTSPFWLLNNFTNASTELKLVKKRGYFNNLFPEISPQYHSKIALVIFPFFYITILAMLASGAKFSYYGWHLYPLFPFLIILLTDIILYFWQKIDLFISLFIFLFLGFSTIRFIFLFLPKEVLPQWPTVIASLGVLMSICLILPKKPRQAIYLFLFFIYIGVNIITVFNLSHIYPTLPQPVN